MSQPLSVAARDVLIEHIDGRPVPIIVPTSVDPIDRPAMGCRYKATAALLKRGFLRTDGSGARPAATVITEAGRMKLASELADWADAIQRAALAISEETGFA